MINRYFNIEEHTSVNTLIFSLKPFNFELKIIQHIYENRLDDSENDFIFAPP